MEIRYHEHVIDDINRLLPEQKEHLKNLLQGSFYNLAVMDHRFQNLHLYKSHSGLEILFLKHPAHILVISIKISR